MPSTSAAIRPFQVLRAAFDSVRAFNCRHKDFRRLGFFLRDGRLSCPSACPECRGLFALWTPLVVLSPCGVHNSRCKPDRFLARRSFDWLQPGGRICGSLVSTWYLAAHQNLALAANHTPGRCGGRAERPQLQNASVNDLPSRRRFGIARNIPVSSMEGLSWNWSASRWRYLSAADPTQGRNLLCLDRLSITTTSMRCC